jgi:hypothetical protein
LVVRLQWRYFGVEESEIVFTRDVVIAQLAARAALRRSLFIALAALAAYYIAATLAASAFGPIPNWLFFGIFILPLAVFLLIVRQLQWSVLATHQLRCPNCRALLAEHRRFINGPTPFCRSCGHLVLLPISVLKRAAAT